MNVFIAFGSARKEGNTAKLLGWIEDELATLGCDVDRVDLVDHDVRGCTGCNTCKLDFATPGCIIEDDTDGLLTRMMHSDAIIVASPLYCWGFSSQAKAFIDRMYSLSKPVAGGMQSLVRGKRIGFVMTAAGGVENNLELAAATFPRIAGLLELENPANLLIGGCKRPADLGEDAQQSARGFARELTGKG